MTLYTKHGTRYRPADPGEVVATAAMYLVDVGQQDAARELIAMMASALSEVERSTGSSTSAQGGGPA